MWKSDSSQQSQLWLKTLIPPGIAECISSVQEVSPEACKVRLLATVSHQPLAHSKLTSYETQGKTLALGPIKMGHQPNCALHAWAT